MARERRIIQTCTHCDKTGHNKRRCPELSKQKKAVLFSVPVVVAPKARKPNTCSLCQSIGHTKKDCDVVFNIEDASEIEERKVKAPLIIKVVNSAKHSPHIVNLKRENPNEKLKNVPVFQEKVPKKEARKVLDLAKEVEKANALYFAQRQKIKKASVSAREIVLARKKYSTTMPAAPVLAEDPKPIDPQETIKALMPYAKRWQSFVQDASKTPERMRGNIKQKLSLVTKGWAVGVAVAVLCVTLPFPALGYYKNLKETGRQIVAESTTAFFSLQSSTVAAFNANIPQAQSDLSAALASFSKADSLLEKDHQILLFIVRALPVIGDEVASRQHLLAGGHHLALGNTYIVDGVEEVAKITGQSVSERVKVLHNYFVSALPQYEAAQTEFKGVDPKDIPTEYQKQFQDFQLLFAAFIDDMRDTVDLSDAMTQLFGDDQFRRYLLVFQNQNELRPSGGFMGSFAVLDVQKGRILNLEVPPGGTYDVQGQLTEYVEPPLPLQVLNKRWEFQDANWWPHFPASAEKMAWFYEHSRGTTVDGVIAVNASVLERMLKITGSLEIVDRNLTLDSTNVLAALQEEVEDATNKTKPKAVIGDMVPLLTDKLAKANTLDLLHLLSEVNSALTGKEIQIYSHDERVAKTIHDFQWGGEVQKTAQNQDYLLVVNSNIHGEKSDAKIKQTIEHQAVVEDGGGIVDTVIIRREHTGIPGEKFYGVDNLSYMRLYVPEGAELIEAGGFTYPPESYFQTPESWYKKDAQLTAVEEDVGVDSKTGTRFTKEFGKTVFGNWVLTKPGETSEVYMVYRLPFKTEQSIRPSMASKTWGVLSQAKTREATRYSLLLQKQSGSSSHFSSTIIFPDGWVPAWKSSDEINLALNGATVEGNLESDRAFGVVMEKANGKLETRN